MGEDEKREEKTEHRMDPLSIINRFITADHWSRQEQYLEMRYALHLLDSATAQTLLPYALDLHDRHVEPSDSEPGLTLLQWLVQVRPEVCTGLPVQLLKRQIFGEGILYYGADAATLQPSSQRWRLRLRRSSTSSPTSLHTLCGGMMKPYNERSRGGSGN